MDFCKSCGAGIPPKVGEGTCGVCNPNGVLIHRAERLLSAVEFFNYHFTVRESHGGVFLQAHYLDNDIYSGKEEAQATRKWLLSPQMTDSEIVSTVFKCCMTSFEHRCREGFRYNGARIFGPHFDIHDLVRLCKDGKEAAGGRVQSVQFPVSSQELSGGKGGERSGNTGPANHQTGKDGAKPVWSYPDDGGPATVRYEKDDNSRRSLSLVSGRTETTSERLGGSDTPDSAA